MMILLQPNKKGEGQGKSVTLELKCIKESILSFFSFAQNERYTRNYFLRSSVIYSVKHVSDVVDGTNATAMSDPLASVHGASSG
jgi:predicted ATPase